MAVVGMEQKRVDQAAGLARNRKKRNFGKENTASASPQSPDLLDSQDSESSDFHQYARDLIQQAQVSRDGDDSHIINNITPQPTTTSTTIPNAHLPPHINQARSTSSSKTDIPLANLFDYTLHPKDGLEFYWPRSKKNLEADLQTHEHAWADELSLSLH